MTSNVVHIANGYRKTVEVSCISEKSDFESNFLIRSGRYKRHKTLDWTDDSTVNIRVKADGRHLGTVNVASNRSIIIDREGNIRHAMYQRWWELREGETVRGKSYIWKCEQRTWHLP